MPPLGAEELVAMGDLCISTNLLTNGRVNRNPNRGRRVTVTDRGDGTTQPRASVRRNTFFAWASVHQRRFGTDRHNRPSSAVANSGTVNSIRPTAWPPRKVASELIRLVGKADKLHYCRGQR